MAIISLSFLPRRRGTGWEETTGFDCLFERFLARRSLSGSRMRQYRIVQKMVHRYETFLREHGRARFVFEVGRVEVATLEGLLRFLRDERLPQVRSDNYMRGVFVMLKSFFAWCEENGVATKRPFERFVMPREEYGTPVILSLAEVERLYHAKMPSKQVEEQRDVFVFQCQVGCRVGDLTRLTCSSVQDGTLSYIAGKTRGFSGRTVSVPLNATAREILAKYGVACQGAGSGSMKGNEPLLPFCSLPEYNKCIRRAFVEAGLTRVVTVLEPATRREVRRPLCELASSHLARRTFAGNLYRQVKDPALVASMTGHADGSRAFARYREIDLEIKRELVRLLEIP